MAEEKPKVVEKPVVTPTQPVPLEEVYQFTTADGQVHAWHGSPEDLAKTYPEATITGQLTLDELGQGYFVAYAPKPATKAKSNAKGASAVSDKDAQTPPPPPPPAEEDEEGDGEATQTEMTIE
jgi:hypothetical protein